MTTQQQQLLNPKPVDFSMHVIASHAHGTDAKHSMAKRKMDALGNLRGESGFANDVERLKRLKSQLELATSMAEIDKETAAEKATKASQATAGLVEKLPGALAKLKANGGDTVKLTMPELSAIAFGKFNGTVLNGKKEDYVRGLNALIQAQPTVLSP